MFLRQKLDELNKEIQRTVVGDDNIFAYHPLQDKVNELAVYLNVTGIGDEPFRDYIKTTTTSYIDKCKKMCNEKIPVNTTNIKDYKKTAIIKIKASVDNAVWWFKKGCKDLHIDILDKSIA